MANEIAKVNGWLLNQSPEVVKKLERKGETVIIGDSKKLGFQDLRLLVPEGIVVYQSIREVRNRGEFFFTAREKDEMSPSYLSWVTKEEKGVDCLATVGALLRYTWYNNFDSSKIFDRLCHSTKETYLYLEDAVQQADAHPFLMYRQQKT